MVGYSLEGIIEAGALVLASFFFGFAVAVTQKTLHRVFNSEEY